MVNQVLKCLFFALHRLRRQIRAGQQAIVSLRPTLIINDTYELEKFMPFEYRLLIRRDIAFLHNGIKIIQRIFPFEN
ncbi:hypothetical protein GK047_16635 [Paenibacillus sp. SYP-B3998]|uniref:Uncharacterized protein n=1 Tax=Paenibacillus sp. SYP-B3998 TaxID=2678564 RepID=A0A6G3ZZV0_9BACL|nr:hypothetical protein [Paenibacillus sp. SYP-B3998]NEW07630.1 hypothetical protein [Paenibacillus sp. SYP-B3998]